MARKTAFPLAPSEQDDSILIFEDAVEFAHGRNGPSLQNVDLKVKEAQEQLLKLRQQQEEIEKQKQHLEVLRQKQERFVIGKRDLTEKMTRMTGGLERELYDAQKLVEELAMTKDLFNRHLEIIKGLQPERWPRHQVDEELDRALSAIADAEDEYAKGNRRVAAARPSASSGFDGIETEGMAGSMFREDDAGSWLRRGFAFMLPLIITLLFALVLAKLMF